MMMKMLEAGGIVPLTDNVRKPDVDNPKGYYEYERAKKIKEDKAGLDEAEGRVVKMVSRLLVDLPGDRRYKVIFMRRNLDETLASQKKMLDRLGEGEGASDEEMKKMFIAHLAEMEDWFRKNPHAEVLYVNYNRMLKDPQPLLEKVNEFLGGHLDVRKMVDVVDPSLYRQRR